jgi:glycine oxidase
MMVQRYDVTVVGGGVIGTATAWRLAEAGLHVLLLERNHLGAEASSAAAGMLGAQLEVHEAGPFYQLCLESRSMFRAFAAALAEETGIDVQLVHNGILQLAYSERDVRRLQAQAKWQTEFGGRAEWWSKEEVSCKEPGLTTTEGALFLPDDSNVSAPLLMRAVSLAVKRRCIVVEGAEVISITPFASSVVVSTATENYESASVVIANGAWASRFLQPLHVDFPIHPVKGQMIAVRPRGAVRLTHTVYTDEAYLVPKRDGTIVVGATEEHGAGFNRDVTMDAIARLSTAFRKIAPGLADAVFERAWIGLRPGSPQGHPLLGPHPEHPNVHFAVGHFRNGILLSPLTAEILTRSVLGEPWKEVWTAFRVENLPAVSTVEEVKG